MTHLYPVLPLFADITGSLLQAPTEGQTWNNESNDHLYVWDGVEWMPLSNRADCAANWGQIADGQTIPKPVGTDGYIFEFHECIWSTSPAALGKFDAFVCFADATGLVTVQYRPIGSPDYIAGTANYIIVGMRGNHNHGYLIPPGVPVASPTPTPIPFASPTPTPGVSAQATQTPTVTPTATPGSSPTPTQTVTPTNTLTPTPTPSTPAPMVVTITDPEFSSSATTLTALCDKGLYSSVSPDSGYLTCAASSLSLCATGACAPEPGDNGIGPVMRVTVTGGVAPYSVKLQNFALNTSNDLLNANFALGDTGWTKGLNWIIGLGYARIDTDDPGVGDTNSDIINNTEAVVTAGTTVTATGSVMDGGNDSNQCAVFIQWLNSSHVEISKSIGNYSADHAPSYDISTVTAVAPVGTAYARLGFRGQARSNGYIRADNASWTLGNTTNSECMFVGGANIAAFPYAGVLKTYTLLTSGSATPIISLNGICGTTNFHTRGTFDIVVSDSAGHVQTFNKFLEIERKGT